MYACIQRSISDNDIFIKYREAYAKSQTVYFESAFLPKRRVCPMSSALTA
jgi:hypothetical protein